MAKPNYQYEKRQRDLAKKQKQDEKRRQKLAAKAAEEGGAASPEDSSDDIAEAEATPGNGTVPDA
ncbi:MAG: hypothetical protein ACOH1Q_09755 [Thiobacillus sp.]